MICCFEARINQLCRSNVDKAESETPLCDLNQNKIGVCFEARERSACSPRKERHAIFRLIKALVMLLHVYVNNFLKSTTKMLILP